VHLDPFISSLPIKQPKNVGSDLEFKLCNLENAASHSSCSKSLPFARIHARRRPSHSSFDCLVNAMSN